MIKKRETQMMTLEDRPLVNSIVIYINFGQKYKCLSIPLKKYKIMIFLYIFKMGADRIETPVYYFYGIRNLFDFVQGSRHLQASLSQCMQPLKMTLIV